MIDREGVDKKDLNWQDIRKGSPDAFRIFFLQFYAEFFSFANLLLHNRASAKNVTSAAFFMVWAKRGDFDNEKNIKAFLYTTIRDNSLRFLRHLQERPDIKEFAPETRFTGTLPEETLQHIQAFADNYDSP